MKNKIFTLMILALAMSSFMASAALASPIVRIGNVDYTSPNAAASYGFIRPSNESQDIGDFQLNIVDYILTGSLTDDNHVYTLLIGTAANPAGVWHGWGAEGLIIDEIAGNSNTNTFGYYTQGNRYELFSGSDDYTTPEKSFTFTSSQDFGFYIGVAATGDTYYTDMAKNLNHGIQAAIFRVDDSNTYLIGFEDLLSSKTDNDLQDMIVSVTVIPNPEPSTMILMGAGVLVAAVMRKRLKKTS